MATDRGPGVLIAVEGTDGSGKSTQLRLLRRYLEGLERPVYLSEWNSDPQIHPIIHNLKRERRFTPLTFALLHAADFLRRYRREIEPRLRLGHVVLADRYVGTALTRDQARGLRAEWVARLYALARKPDLTFFFDAPVEETARRVLRRARKFGYYEAGMDMGLAGDPMESFLRFQGSIRRHYQELAGEHGFVRVDAGRGILPQQAEVRREVRRLLRGLGLAVT